MSGITSGVGLASGLDIGALVDTIINAQRGPILLLDSRRQGFESVQTGLKTVEAFVLSIKSAVQSLGNESTVDDITLTNSDTDQLVVSASSSAVPGTHQFRTVRTASSHGLLSGGFANADTQKVGAGTLVLSPGGELATSTRLDLFNGGLGVGRGTIRITDRDGNTADIDLTTAHDVDDVLEAINTTAGINVTASANGDHLELVDSSTGGGNFSVAEVGGGTTAADLGIATSTSGGTITGSTVYELTEDFTLNLLNDGNAIRRTSGGEDIRITLTDDTVIEINLDDAASIADVVNTINDHEDNGGKVAAALVNGTLQLTDTSGGGGSSSFTIEDINNADVVEALGLDTAESGGVISGRRLLAGINSVLLDNLNGGSGITTPGSVSFTDRAGNTSTIDFSSATSLDEVLAAINDDGTIQIEATVNAAGTGIQLTDVSGGGGNLVVADVASGSVAANLGIAVDVASSSVDSGSLNHRYVNEATRFDDLLPSGTTLGTGDLRITDSAGNEETISISGAVETIGDVIDRINAATDVQVTATLNDTGDGIVVIDEAGGAGTLAIEDAVGSVAAQLGFDSTVFTGGDSKQRISGRAATTIEIEATDTLQDVVDKLNDAGGHFSASVVNTGSAINPFRLQLDATATGESGRFYVQSDGGLGLQGFAEGEDALLRIGSDASAGFLVSSSTNTFDDVVSGLDVTVRAAGSTAATVVIAEDVEKLSQALGQFVKSYNAFVDDVDAKTAFNVDNNQRGVLNGNSTVLRVSSRLNSLVNRRLSGFGTEAVGSLSDLGVRITTGGKLTFDTSTFEELIESDPDAVREFLLREDTGFAAVAEASLDALTDPFTGSFELADNALQSSVDSLESRIADLESILDNRKQQLLLQFVRSEQAISLLQSQQQALGGIAPLRINPAPTGASSS